MNAFCFRWYDDSWLIFQVGKCKQGHEVSCIDRRRAYHVTVCSGWFYRSGDIRLLRHRYFPAFFEGFRFSFPFASQVLEIIRLRISIEHDALWEGNTYDIKGAPCGLVTTFLVTIVETLLNSSCPSIFKVDFQEFMLNKNPWHQHWGRRGKQ